MSLGEKAELFIKSEYGYGEQGAGADIPPNTNLIFKVELVQIGDKVAGQMPDGDLLKYALEFKE